MPGYGLSQIACAVRGRTLSSGVHAISRSCTRGRSISHAPCLPMNRVLLMVALLVSCLVSATRANAQSTPATSAPAALHWEALALDAAGDRIVLFGGVTRELRYLAGTWAWHAGTWRRIADSISGPSARHAHAMVWDPVRLRVLLYGGAIESPGVPERRFCDTWALDGRGWQLVSDSACGERRSTAALLVYDPGEQSVVLLEGPASPPADTAARRLRIWRLQGDRWLPVDSSGPRRTAPGGAAWDARRDVLVVPVLDGPDAGVWEWDRETWKVRAARGPASRRMFAATYAAHLGGVLIAGGQRADDERPLDDLWRWDGREWAPVAQEARSPGPVARSHATLLTDATRGRVAYFGGAGVRGLLRELWWLDARGWHPEAMEPSPSRARP